MKIFRAFLVSVFFSLFFIAQSFAVGIGVKPLRTELTVAPGQTKSTIIHVINGEQSFVKARPIIEVYTKNDESGFPVSGDLADDDPRNITSWVSFSDDITEIKGGGETAVTITVSVPEDAEPGGRYAAILYEPVIEDNSGGVQIRSRVASLLLITVTGEQKREGVVNDFNLNLEELASDLPITFDVSFENKGNIHLSPKGSVTILDKKGNQIKEVARYMDRKTGKEIVADAVPLNPNAGNVLPGSYRVFPAKWNESLRIGEFSANLRLTYPGSSEPIEKSTSFEILEELSISGFDLESSSEGNVFVFNVKNKGNIKERLVGTITVKNEFEFSVAEIELPTDLDYVLGGETKEITIPWLKKELPKGKYEALLSVTHGFSKTKIEKTITFGEGELPLLLIFGILGGVVLLVLGFLFLKKKK